MWSNENKCPEGLFGLNEINVKTHSRETQFYFVKKARTGPAEWSNAGVRDRCDVSLWHKVTFLSVHEPLIMP